MLMRLKLILPLLTCRPRMSICAPHAGDFAADGVEERFSLPRLNSEGVGPLSLPLPPSQAAQLKAVASQAPFGRGEKTVVDTTVRNALQLHSYQIQIKFSGDALYFPVLL